MPPKKKKHVGLDLDALLREKEEEEAEQRQWQEELDRRRAARQAAAAAATTTAAAAAPVSAAEARDVAAAASSSEHGAHNETSAASSGKASNGPTKAGRRSAKMPNSSVANCGGGGGDGGCRRGGGSGQGGEEEDGFERAERDIAKLTEMSRAIEQQLQMGQGGMSAHARATQGLFVAPSSSMAETTPSLHPNVVFHGTTITTMQPTNPLTHGTPVHSQTASSSSCGGNSPGGHTRVGEAEVVQMLHADLLLPFVIAVRQQSSQATTAIACQLWNLATDVASSRWEGEEVETLRDKACTALCHLLKSELYLPTSEPKASPSSLASLLPSHGAAEEAPATASAAAAGTVATTEGEKAPAAGMTTGGAVAGGPGAPLVAGAVRAGSRELVGSGEKEESTAVWFPGYNDVRKVLLDMRYCQRLLDEDACAVGVAAAAAAVVSLVHVQDERQETQQDPCLEEPEKGQTREMGQGQHQGAARAEERSTKRAATDEPRERVVPAQLAAEESTQHLKSSTAHRCPFCSTPISIPTYGGRERRGRKMLSSSAATATVPYGVARLVLLVTAMAECSAAAVTAAASAAAAAVASGNISLTQPKQHAALLLTPQQAAVLFLHLSRLQLMPLPGDSAAAADSLCAALAALLAVVASVDASMDEGCCCGKTAAAAAALGEAAAGAAPAAVEAEAGEEAPSRGTEAGAVGPVGDEAGVVVESAAHKKANASQRSCLASAVIGIMRKLTATVTDIGNQQPIGQVPDRTADADASSEGADVLVRPQAELRAEPLPMSPTGKRSVSRRRRRVQWAMDGRPWESKIREDESIGGRMREEPLLGEQVEEGEEAQEEEADAIVPKVQQGQQCSNDSTRGRQRDNESESAVWAWLSFRQVLCLPIAPPICREFRFHMGLLLLRNIVTFACNKGMQQQQVLLLEQSQPQHEHKQLEEPSQDRSSLRLMLEHSDHIAPGDHGSVLDRLVTILTSSPQLNPIAPSTDISIVHLLVLLLDVLVPSPQLLLNDTGVAAPPSFAHFPPSSPPRYRSSRLSLRVHALYEDWLQRATQIATSDTRPAACLVRLCATFCGMKYERQPPIHLHLLRPWSSSMPTSPS